MINEFVTQSSYEKMIEALHDKEVELFFAAVKAAYIVVWGRLHAMKSGDRFIVNGNTFIVPSDTPIFYNQEGEGFFIIYHRDDIRIEVGVTSKGNIFEE